jgi:hypothetical protein
VNADLGESTYTHLGDNWTVIVTDNDGIASLVYTLSGATEGSGTSLNGVSFNLGVTTVTWVATDNSGNTVECSFTVTVNNAENPIFVVDCSDIGNQVVSTDTGESTYIHSGDSWDVEATSNVGLASLVYSLSGATTGSGESSLDGVMFNLGVTVVTWTATDISGNSAECSYSVTVEDTEAPVLIVSCSDIDDQTVETLAGENYYINSGTGWDVVAEDNVGIATITWTLSGATMGEGSNTLDNALFNVGETLVTWLVVDIYGNSVTCSFTVTVEDNEAPIFIVDCDAIGDQTVTIGFDETTYTHVGTGWDVFTTDNVGIGSKTWKFTGATETEGSMTIDGAIFNVGTTIVTWTITDLSGNTIECSYSVTVTQEEDLDPYFIVSCDEIGDQEVSLLGDETTYTHAGTSWDVTAGDDMGIASLVWELSGSTEGSGSISLDGVTFNLGVTTVRWTATDVTGNVIECSYTVTVYGGTTLTITGDTEICLGEAMVLTAVASGEEVVSYLWSTGETTATITRWPMESTVFSVTVVNIHGVSTTASVEVIVHALPEVTIDIEYKDTYCIEEPVRLTAVNLTADDIVSYLWSTGETTESIDYVPSYGLNGDNYVTVTVTNEYGCDFTADITFTAEDCYHIPVIVYPNPADDHIIIEGGFTKITLLDEAGNLILWKYADEGTYYMNIDVSYLASGTYVVYIELLDGRFDTKKIIIYHQ